MSANIVRKSTIDALVHVMLHGPAGCGRWHADYLMWKSIGADGEEQWIQADHMSADEIGQLLWVENLTSVAYRYPSDSSGERPGAGEDVPDEVIFDYEYARPAAVPTPVQALRLIDYLSYQSCEHPSWEQSQAHRALLCLRGQLIRQLPGYDDAPSEWPEVARA